MKKEVIFLTIIVILTSSLMVNASSGRLKKDSIKSCNGVLYGRHSSDNHWHVAEKKGDWYYATGNAIYSNPCVSSSSSNQNDNSVSSESQKENVQPKIEKEEKILSSDNTLKSIRVDSKELDVADIINYSTKKEKISIEVTPNDVNAKYEIKNNKDLEIGINEISINVIAEDKTIKTYLLKVQREKILSSETGIEITINDKPVTLKDKMATIYVGSQENDVKIDYKLTDSNAKVEMNELQELKTGDNKLVLKVTAEDDSTANYEITIYKQSEIEELVVNILSLICLIGMGVACYLGIKTILKKVKRNHKTYN